MQDINLNPKYYALRMQLRLLALAKLEQLNKQKVAEIANGQKSNIYKRSLSLNMYLNANILFNTYLMIYNYSLFLKDKFLPLFPILKLAKNYIINNKLKFYRYYVISNNFNLLLIKHYKKKIKNLY